jgi:hypothetical protein
MALPFRVYTVPDDESESAAGEPSVPVRLGDLLPLVALAHRRNYLWLRDFLDDEVTISSDLFEVLQAFQSYRPSA